MSLKETKDALEDCSERLKVNRAEMINLELENFQLKNDLDCFLEAIETEPDSGQASGKASGKASARSAPLSRRTSPLGYGPTETRANSTSDGHKSFHLMQTMSHCIEEKTREISQLKNMLQVFEVGSIFVVKMFYP